MPEIITTAEPQPAQPHPFMERLNNEAGFQGADAPASADMYRCVHCGLCLSSCPTYIETRLEPESPRGRIAYMKAVTEGRLGVSQRVASHWELCLQCRACEAVCPSGVPYGRIMERTRAQMLAQGKQSPRLKLMTRLFLRAGLAHPTRLRVGAQFIRFYQRSGLQRLVQASRVLKALPFHAAELEQQLPPMCGKFFVPTRRVYRARGEKKLTVGLLSGCVMPLMQGDTMRAAVRVLTRNGCDVVVPMGQTCCGALSVHSGDLEYGRRMARRNIDVFLQAGVDKIVTASAGCGSTMKEYHELLRDDPAYTEKAERFSKLTVDITEFLAALPFAAPKARLDLKVTYQDPCHLAHAQRITLAPRQIMRAIPGLELVEMEQASLCCGAAGIYTVTQRDMAQRLLERKLRRVEATGTWNVATANPGCMLQLEQGIRRRGAPGRVWHVVDLLDAAYQAEDAAVSKATRAR